MKLNNFKIIRVKKSFINLDTKEMSTRANERNRELSQISDALQQFAKSVYCVYWCVIAKTIAVIISTGSLAGVRRHRIASRRSPAAPRSNLIKYN